MGNKMKKLICALLASAMLVGSVGVVGFADEDTNAETVVQLLQKQQKNLPMQRQQRLLPVQRQQRLLL